jgi:hypothetical protein
MWHDTTPVSRLSDQKVCPVMSDSQGMVYCLRSDCYAAYPRSLMGEVLWFCELIDGPNPDIRVDHDT